MPIPDIVENAKQLASVLRERAEETERLRRLPVETIQDFQQAGFFKALQPAAYGGYELPVRTFLHAVIEVSRGCGSSGWVLAVLGIHNWLLALFDEQAQRDLWSQDPMVLASTSYYMASGQMVPTDGGFRLSGRWSFGSGSDHAAWMILGAVVPSQEEGQPPDMYSVLVPKQDFETVDTWHASSLTGTGSHDTVVKDAFVPAYRALSTAAVVQGAAPGLRVNTAPTYRLPFPAVFANAIAVSGIGMALGALDAYREHTKSRVLISQHKQQDRMAAQMRLAEASGEIDSAQLLVERDFIELENLAAAGEAPTIEQRVRYRFDAAYLVVLCKRAVERLFTASGGHALHNSNPIQRAYRDLLGVSSHAALNPDEVSALSGRVQLGLAPNDPFI